MTRVGDVAETLQAVAAALEQIEAPAMLIGGMAVIAHGVARTTRDVDIAVAGGVVEPSALLAAFEGVGFVPRVDDALAFAARSQVLLLRHEHTDVELDVSLGWLQFELDALASAERVTVAGTDLPVARAEDLVVYKTVAWRPQDQLDVERLIELHGERMDLDRIRKVVRVLAEALEAPERPAALERIIGTAMG